MADLDGDGHVDFLTGSYWPGDLYFIRGLAGGAFAPPEILKSSDGKNVNAGGPWKSEQDPDWDSMAPVPCLVDHDGDGDLDLYIGNIQGRVIHIPNVGSAKKYSFDQSKRRALEAGGTEIKVQGDSGPWVADWDGDGLTDLVVGSADGAVWWYRNQGKKGAPEYAAGVALLKATPGESVAHDAAPTQPGHRTKVCVADWNLDGRMDLLVGDYWSQKAPPKDLTGDEKNRLAELKKKQQELQKQYSGLYEKLGDKAGQDPEFAKVQGEMSKVWEQLSKLEPSPASHGSVWLYLREPAAK